MEFSEQYLTYEEYRSLGGTLDQTSFNLLEFEAQKRIDLRTQNRLKNIDSEDIPNEVKLCVYHLIGKIQLYQKNIKTNINSETVGSYHVEYKNIQDILKNKSYELDDIILNDLYGVIVNGEHVIYNGVKR